MCELAPLFALGSLDPAERREFEQHLSGCEACRAEVAEFADAAARMAVAEAKPAAPVLRQRLFERLAGELSDTIPVGGAEGWRPTPFPGVEVKRLFFDSTTGALTQLVRVGPGAVYPAHVHAGVEHLYVIDGEVIFDDHTLGEGEYEISDADSHHSAVRSTEGCLLLIMHNVKDKLLK